VPALAATVRITIPTDGGSFKPRQLGVAPPGNEDCRQQEVREFSLAWLLLALEFAYTSRAGVELVDVTVRYSAGFIAAGESIRGKQLIDPDAGSDVLQRQLP